jgi:nitrogen PTS system EIIA component
MEGRMKLSDFVVREAILVDLQATTKEAAIREIVRSLVEAGRLAEADLDGVARAILNREELGSTGIGQGVAVPHTRHPKVDRLVGTVALSRRGVDFAALDGEPVDILFLLVSPPNQPGDHLRALENISRHLKDERFVSFLRQAKTREQVVELLEEADHAGA